MHNIYLLPLMERFKRWNYNTCCIWWNISGFRGIFPEYSLYHIFPIGSVWSPVWGPVWSPVWSLQQCEGSAATSCGSESGGECGCQCIPVPKPGRQGLQDDKDFRFSPYAHTGPTGTVYRDFPVPFPFPGWNFRCLDLHFGCLGLFWGVWTCILGVWTCILEIRTSILGVWTE